jgi:hypothetical protein
MLFVGGLFEGPKTRAQYELEKCSKAGLLSLLNIFLTVDDWQRQGTDYQYLFDCAVEAKKDGRTVNASRRIKRMLDDPHAEYESYERRQRSAKAAANRRKKRARQTAKEVKA